VFDSELLGPPSTRDCLGVTQRRVSPTHIHTRSPNLLTQTLTCTHPLIYSLRLVQHTRTQSPALHTQHQHGFGGPRPAWNAHTEHRLMMKDKTRPHVGTPTHLEDRGRARDSVPRWQKELRAVMRHRRPLIVVARPLCIALCCQILRLKESPLPGNGGG
jgi:hypothetical protein